MAKLHDEMNEEEKKMNGIAPEEDIAEGTSDKEETAETIHPDEAEDAGPDDTKEPADQPDVTGIIKIFLLQCYLSLRSKEKIMYISCVLRKDFSWLTRYFEE